jgi:hypothetical protein
MYIIGRSKYDTRGIGSQDSDNRGHRSDKKITKGILLLP